LAATSNNPHYATNNVETVVVPGTTVRLGGTGFDTVNGAAIDLFCACPGGKLGPFLLRPGTPGLSETVLSFPLPVIDPPGSATGPGSFVVSNRGPAGTYLKKSNAVSVPIGAAVSVSFVNQSGRTMTVDGTGFSALTVVNLFNNRPTGAVNLGGLKPDGTPTLPLTIISASEFSFSLPASAIPGPSYVQVLNPPFVPFTSSGTNPAGAFTLK
jgi:hypothetical protein